MTSHEVKLDESQIDSDSKRTSNILYEISKETHVYVKERTSELTKLKKVGSSSRIPTYSPKPFAEVKADTLAKAVHAAKIYEERLDQHPELSSSDEARGGPPFAKDYARIIHSPSFRRLQGKSQLIPAGENEFFRTRLTHSLEVAEIATRIARRFNDTHPFFEKNKIDTDLVSCSALLHDIGHPPFGHSGEEALNEKMEYNGGFEGNAQTLRLITRLENRLGRKGSISDLIANPRGLNLTIGTLASILKYDRRSEGPNHHNGQLMPTKGYYPDNQDVVDKIKSHLGVPPDKKLYTIECQIMDIADDIAYSAYDLEDTLEAQIISPFDLMSIDDDTLHDITKDIKAQLSKRESQILVTEQMVLEQLSIVFGSLLILEDKYNLNKNRDDRLTFIGRTYAESEQHAKNPLVRRQYLETLIEGNIDGLHVELDEEFPFLSSLIVEPSRLITIEAMKAFNFHKVITSRRLQLQHHRSKKIVSGIFDAYRLDKTGRLLSSFQRHQLKSHNHQEDDETFRMRFISDVISGLTDSEAIRLYDQLHSSRNAPFLGYSRQ